MAQLVEIDGLSAAGKSTLYAALIKLTSDASNPVDDALREKVLLNDSMSHTRNDHFIINKYSVDAEFEEFSRQYPVVVNYFLDGIAALKPIGGKDLRSDYIQYAKSRFARFQYLERNPFRGEIVSDEGLMCCIDFAIDGAPGAGDLDKINNVLDLAKLPSGIIYIKASAETLARRVHERNQHCIDRNYPHYDLIEKNYAALKKKEVLYNVIEARGHSVLRLNGEGSPDENLVQTLNYLKQLVKIRVDPKCLVQ